MFESEKGDRVSDFDLKLMSIESEHLGIPDQDYSAEVKMPSSEYQRICRSAAHAVTKHGMMLVLHWCLPHDRQWGTWHVTTHAARVCTAQVLLALLPCVSACRDLASIGDTVMISATKEGVKFSTTGDIGTANIALRCAAARSPAVTGCGSMQQLTGPQAPAHSLQDHAFSYSTMYCGPQTDVGIVACAPAVLPVQAKCQCREA